LRPALRVYPFLDLTVAALNMAFPVSSGTVDQAEKSKESLPEGQGFGLSLEGDVLLLNG